MTWLALTELIDALLLMTARRPPAVLAGEHSGPFADERIASLKAGQTADLADLTERHAQQQREHSTAYDRERSRYLRELDAAAKRLAEIEERRRQEERAERDRTRDGPEPPERAR
jgi:hypothetical protein